MADPTTVPDLRLWLKADSIATSVVDVSSWGNSAPGFTAEALTQGTAAKMPVRQGAVLNGLPGVYFNGDDGLVASDVLLDLFRNLGGATVFVVARHEWATTTGTTLVFGSPLYFSRGGNAGSVRAFHQIYADTAATRDETIRIGGRRLDTDGFQENVSPNGAWPRMAWKVGTGIYDWANAQAQTYLDGALSVEKLPFQTAGLTSDTRSLAGAVGSNPAATAEFLLGTVVEILVYQRVLTAAERATVHTYLSDRYAITVADYVLSAAGVAGSAGLSSVPALGVGTVAPEAISVVGAAGLSSAPALGVGTVAPEATSVAGSAGLSSASALGAGAVQPQPATVSGATGLSSASALGAGAVQPQPATVSGATGLSSASALGVGTVVPAGAGVTGLSGLTSNTAFGVGGATSAIAAPVVAGAAGLASLPAFGAGSVSPAPVAVSGGTGLASAPTLGVGAVQQAESGVVAGGAGLVSVSALGLGTVLPAAAAITGSAGLASLPVLGSGSVQAGAAGVVGGMGLSSGSALGQGVVTGEAAPAVEGVSGLANAPVFGSGLVTPDPVLLAGLTGLQAPQGFGGDGAVLPPINFGLFGMFGLASEPALGPGQVIDVNAFKGVRLSVVGPFGVRLNAVGPRPARLSVTGPRVRTESVGPTRENA